MYAHQYYEHQNTLLENVRVRALNRSFDRGS